MEQVLDKKEVMKAKIKEIMKPVEANVVGCMWSKTELYYDYADLTRKTFKNPIWSFYYTVGLKVVNKNITVLDEVAVEVYIKDNPQLMENYEKYGKFDIIDNLKSYITVDNIEAYINDLKKWSALYDIVDNLTIDESVITDAHDMDINDLYDYFNAQMNSIFINADDGVESHKLEDDLDDIIEEANKGLNVGMPIPSDILSEEIGGVMQGQIILVGGLSGTGKTGFTIQMMLSSLFENEEAGGIMLNEQDHVKWKQELLTWIINNKLIHLEKFKNCKPFNKKRWRQGNFTDEEHQLLKAASKYLKNKMKNNQIVLIHFKSYSRKQAERVIRKYASLGVKNFVLDTFKISSDRDNTDSFWLSMQEDMRKFDDLIKPSNLDVSLWVTLQLQKGSALKRYLTGDSIGMAKNVIDVASVGLLMRRLRNDEYSDGKYPVKVWKPLTKESMQSGKEIKLDRNRKYVVIFIEKNRNGEAQSYQIVAEQDLGRLVYKEIGICDIPFDS
ncbi:hypothetical protein BEH_07855 [Priestia filamentosa]|uniref:Replicative DNA helicase n=1 Tax=Priestia filamentosa TaxID=1402861 RepID=A0A0H4KUP5_9BACI|nr:hypothetical protein [Priestia filamentosa]AKO92023.1 hypothetical protein BEH_07855 [Priestia filamentosa]